MRDTRFPREIYLPAEPRKALFWQIFRACGVHSLGTRCPDVDAVQALKAERARWLTLLRNTVTSDAETSNSTSVAHR